MQLSDIISAVSGGNAAERQSRIYAGEAHLIWETLQQYYDYYEFSMILINNISDTDFKVVAAQGVRDMMATQIKKLEGLLDTFSIPMPKRPPEKVIESGETEIWRDELIFNLLVIGLQNSIGIHLRGVNLFMSDGLRNLYNGFLVEELKLHDSLMKYGKLKGWVPDPPTYTQFS